MSECLASVLPCSSNTLRWAHTFQTLFAGSSFWLWGLCAFAMRTPWRTCLLYPLPTLRMLFVREDLHALGRTHPEDPAIGHGRLCNPLTICVFGWVVSALSVLVGVSETVFHTGAECLFLFQTLFEASSS